MPSTCYRALTTASMGPRPFSRGNGSGSSCRRSRQFASMGPRPFSRGNRNAEASSLAAHCASMGPRPFSRGNVRTATTDAQHDRQMLQWGHGLSAVEIMPSREPDSCARDGFNGATAFQPWKWHLLETHGHAMMTASMGPRPFSRGNRTCTLMALVDVRCASMGPRPFSRGNASQHRADATSTRASMGPRPFSRGNACSPDIGRSSRYASMGPRPFSRGNASLRSEHDRRWHSASMGPRPFSRGNGIRTIADATA